MKIIKGVGINVLAIAVAVTVLSCGDDEPAEIAQNEGETFCERAKECAEEQGGQSAATVYNSCINGVDSDLDTLEMGYGESCMEAYADWIGCEAEQNCAVVLSDGAGCVNEHQQFQLTCENDQLGVDSGGTGGDTPGGQSGAKKLCSRDLQCGAITEAEHDQCVVDVMATVDQQSATYGAACEDSWVVLLECWSSQDCYADLSAECSTEEDAVTTQCGGGSQ